MFFVCIIYHTVYLRVLPPPPREYPPPPEERIAPPVDAGIEERILELLEERIVALLLLECVAELLVLERIVLELLERFTEGAVERVAVVTPDERFTVVVVREGATAVCDRVVEDCERVAVLTVAAFRVDEVRTAVLSTRVALLARLASDDPTRLVVRTFVLPKVRDASAVLRFDTRVVAALPSALTRDAPVVRIAA